MRLEHVLKELRLMKDQPRDRFYAVVGIVILRLVIGAALVALFEFRM